MNVIRLAEVRRELSTAFGYLLTTFRGSEAISDPYRQRSQPNDAEASECVSPLSRMIVADCLKRVEGDPVPAGCRCRRRENASGWTPVATGICGERRISRRFSWLRHFRSTPWYRFVQVGSWPHVFLPHALVVICGVGLYVVNQYWHILPASEGCLRGK